MELTVAQQYLKTEIVALFFFEDFKSLDEIFAELNIDADSKAAIKKSINKDFEDSCV